METVKWYFEVIGMVPLKWLWQYLKPHSIKFCINNLIVNTIFILISLLVSWSLGQLVDQVLLGGHSDMLWMLLSVLVGITLLRTTMAYFVGRVNERISQDVVHEIRKKAYRILSSQDFTYFDANRTGDIMSRMTGDLETVRHFTAFVMAQLYKCTLMIITSLGMMFLIHPPFSLLMLAVSPFIAFAGLRFAKSVLPRFQEIRQQFSKLNTKVQEAISGHRVVKAFTREAHEIKQFDVENQAYAEKNVAASRVWMKFLPVLELLCYTMNVLVLLAGGLFVMGGSLTLGGLVTFNVLIGRLNGPLRQLGWLINDFQRFMASADKIRQMMEAKPRITNDGVKLPDLELKGAVEFRDVTFRYRSANVLEDINFKILPGQTAAFIGATGSGKSTVMNLILRFYESTDGLVLLDRVNVNNIDLKVLRSQISIAMQDVFLFTDTIEGNIAYGAPEATLDDVREVARLAQADDFILEFPEGYDTIVGERGVGLSGGQRQRIALARTLLTKPTILILDDTTSSLDLETEHAIQKALKGYRSGQTTLTIAHRIASVRHCDRIFVMEHGRIIEEGTHESLLEKKGYYYDVYVNQMGDFDQESDRMKEVG